MKVDESFHSLRDDVDAEKGLVHFWTNWGGRINEPKKAMQKMILNCPVERKRDMNDIEGLIKLSGSGRLKIIYRICFSVK